MCRRENHILFGLYLGGRFWVHLTATLEANLTNINFLKYGNSFLVWRILIRSAVHVERKSQSRIEKP